MRGHHEECCHTPRGVVVNWATPTWAAIAAAIAIPTLIILYFLKLRRRTVEISSTLLWKKAIQDLQANAPFQRLRRNILLFLQLLVLGAALLALAQPQTAEERSIGNRIVLLIDRSASMGSTDTEDGRTRLEAAKDRAIEIVRAMREPDVFDRGQADEAMLIAFDTDAEILARFTLDKDALVRAIRAIEQTDAPSSITEAFRLAQAQRPRRTFIDNAGGTTAGTEVEVNELVGGPGLRFHLFSDGRIDDLTDVVLNEERSQGGQAVSSTDSFEYHAVGAPTAGNIALIGLRAERDYLDPGTLSIFASVQSTHPEPRSVEVELELPDRGTIAIRTVSLPGATAPIGAAEGTPPEPATSGVVFEFAEPRGVVAEIRLRPGEAANDDVLPADNRGWLVVPPAKRSSVAVVTGGNLFISEALAGMPLARLDTFTPEQFDALLARGQTGRYDVVLLDQHLPPVPAGSTGLPPGRWVVIGAVPEMGLIDKGPGGAAGVLAWDRVHPVLRDVVLDGLRIAETRVVELTEDSSAQVIAELPVGPGIIEVANAEARAIVVPWDVARSTWPWDVGFVVFLASSIDYLSRDAVSVQLGGSPRQIAPGDVLTARLPTDADNPVLIPPAGVGLDNRSLVPSPDGSVAYGPIRRAGVYGVRWRGSAGPADAADGERATRFFAANLLSPSESDVRTLAALDLGSRSVEASGKKATRLREFWPWLVGAALALMMLEWFVFNRKVYV